MFSGETQILQFYVFCRGVRRLSQRRNSPQYIVPTVKNAAKVINVGAICANE